MFTETLAVDIPTMQRLVQEIQRREASAQFTAGSRFVADLGFKSLELIGLVFNCERAFGVSLISRPGLLAELQTVGQAVDAIRGLQAGNAADRERHCTRTVTS